MLNSHEVVKCIIRRGPQLIALGNWAVQVEGEHMKLHLHMGRIKLHVQNHFC